MLSKLLFNRNVRVAILPCSESISCLFRTRLMEASDNLVYNELFCVGISYSVLRQKTLRIDVCAVDKCHLEECLVSAHFSLSFVYFCLKMNLYIGHSCLGPL